MDEHPESQESKQSDLGKLLTDLLERRKREYKETQGYRFWQWNVLISMPSSLEPEPSDGSLLRNFNTHSPWNDHQPSPCARSLRKERAVLIHHLRSRQWEPLPDLSSSDFRIQVQFTIDLALELGIAALEAPTVQKVLSNLEAIILNVAMPLPLRKTVLKFMQELFKVMLPAAPRFSMMKEWSVPGSLRRFAILGNYE
jgi:hypothetical protein